LRTCLTFLAIVFVACLGLAAILLVATGRGHMYSTGIGWVARTGALATLAIGIAIAAAAFAAILHACAHAAPRRYYALMGWRDIAWLSSLVALLVATLVYFGGVLTYGAR
jgi:hypothetical protein